jgi:hypothetical protein
MEKYSKNIFNLCMGIYKYMEYIYCIYTYIYVCILYICGIYTVFIWKINGSPMYIVMMRKKIGKINPGIPNSKDGMKM